LQIKHWNKNRFLVYKKIKQSNKQVFIAHNKSHRFIFTLKNEMILY
jgi:hypothetical protein